ncbi:hypothetical protein ACE02H_11875 [Shewanella mangrovisoli]|uniref:hypothetical protein n=1 Tax=Shewanella mangrovisoli TaxID=2864211 RepID=UPI0035B89E49
MELMDAHVVLWNEINSRLDGWKINESVWDWLVRKTNLRATKANIKKLADDMYIGEATLHRLKKTKQHSLNRESLRKQLSKYTFEISGFNIKSSLGYYGYPPGTVYVNRSSEDLNNEQIGINNVIKSDFFKVISNTEKECVLCDFCNAKDYDFNLYETTKESDGYYLFLSTHRHKQYGAVSNVGGKGFDLEFAFCEKCLHDYYAVLLMPISSLIKLITEKHKLSQHQIAIKLNVLQGVISRVENDKLAFVNHKLLKKLYGLYLIGDYSDNQSNYNKLLSVIVDFTAGKIDFDTLCVNMGEVDACFNLMSPLGDFYTPSECEQIPFSLDFLMEYGYIDVIAKNFDGGTPTSSVEYTIKNKILGVYVDSEEISCWYEIDYRFEGNTGYPYFEGTYYSGNVFIEHKLISMGGRRTKSINKIEGMSYQNSEKVKRFLIKNNFDLGTEEGEYDVENYNWLERIEYSDYT